CSKPVTSKDKEVNMATGDYDDALVCCVENTIDDRIMHSGASFHATHCKEELERFKLRSGKFRLADDKTLDISGVKDVVLKSSFGTSWTMKDVSLVVARGNKRGSMYMVEVPSDGINVTIDGRGNATLWHQRLRHMSEKEEGGSRYYVTFIDDSSKKVWVYFLRNKSKVFNTFKKWKAAVENETNLRVKCLKSDNGGEYSSREFIEYYAKNGIKMLKTVPETPQQNGIAERINQTLKERAKSIRLHARPPKMLWADSVTTAAYLINRGPSVPLGFRIPEEEWQEKEVSLAHLRVFGCDSYVKVKDVARDKLDEKSVKCTFIGYGSDEMGYRFWDSKSHKVIRSIDVTFNEDSLYGVKAATDSSNLTKPNQKDQVVFEDSLENLANKSIVTKHGLSSEITQSPGRNSDTSEGSKNSRRFEDSGRSDKEYSEDKASSEEGDSETL
ncbi:retrovirus-related pol polyprotein from transposon TNT 1-94, partial [Tanacetum coccineum]